MIFISTNSGMLNGFSLGSGFMGLDHIGFLFLEVINVAQAMKGLIYLIESERKAQPSDVCRRATQNLGTLSSTCHFV
jgi:hypothetical protein